MALANNPNPTTIMPTQLAHSTRTAISEANHAQPIGHGTDA